MADPLKSAVFRRTAALLALALGLGGVASGCRSPSAAPDAGAVSPIAVPAPAGLVAEVFLGTPDATWSRARALLGGPTALLPASAAGLVANLLGLPIAVAPEIDGGVPMVGALVDAPGRPRPQITLGIHVKDGARFVDQLTRGEGARFRANPDAATSITRLEATQGTSPVTLGVLDNYLLVAESAEDLTLVGPYVARTLPQAPVPKEDLAIELARPALEGPVLKAAQRAWENARSAEGAPRASAVPLAAIVERGLAMLGDLERARLTVVLDESAHVRVSGAPRPGDGPASRALAELAVGDVKPLLELPADALVGILVRDRAALRAEGIPRLVDAIAGLVEGELPAAERERISAALRAASDARGDWFVGGLRFDGAGPTAFLRASVSDQARLEGAIADLLKATEIRPIQAALGREGIRLSSGKAPLAQPSDDVRRIRFERAAGSTPPGGAGGVPARKPGAGSGGPGKQGGPAAAVASPSLPAAVEILYLVRGDGLFAAVGSDPGEGLRRVVAAPQGENLGGAPAVKAALAPLGADVAFAAVIEPLRLVASRLGRPGGGESAPVVIAVGAAKDGPGAPAALWARADVAAAAIREMARLAGAL